LGGANQGNVAPLQFNNSNLSLPDFTSASELGYLAQFNDTIFLTAINEHNSNMSKINIFPNPAQDKIFLSSENFPSGKYHLIIYNSIGEAVKEDIFYSSVTQTIDISQLNNGVYFIVLATGGRIYKKPIYVIK